MWLVTTRRDDHAAKVEQIAHTPAELRELIDTARADPLVWHHHVDSQRRLVGDEPTHCTCGTAYRTAGSWPTPHDWLDCPCGGHFWWGCRDCDAEQIEPPLAYDCRPHHPRKLGPRRTG